MKFVAIVLLSLLASCAITKEVANSQPLNYSYLQPKISLDLLMPSVKDTVIDNKLLDFESMPLDSGKLITIYKDTLKIRPGILISEKKAAYYVYYKTNYEYQYRKATLANNLYSQYYDNSLSAEKVYQEEIKQLRKQVERTWLEKNIVYFGVITGIAAAILTEFAVIQAQK